MVGSLEVPRSLIFIGSEITGPRTVRYHIDFEASRTPISVVLLTAIFSPFRDADQVALCRHRRSALRAITIGNATRMAFNCATIVERPTWAITHANRTSAASAIIRGIFLIGLGSLQNLLPLCASSVDSGRNQSLPSLVPRPQRFGPRSCCGSKRRTRIDPLSDTCVRNARYAPRRTDFLPVGLRCER